MLIIFSLKVTFIIIAVSTIKCIHMKHNKLFKITAISAVLCLTACEFSANETVINQDSLRQDSILRSDSITALRDTTLGSIDDSLKANLDSARAKLKDGMQDLKAGAQQLGKVIEKKTKQGAEVVKEGAQKVGTAVKEGAENTRDALKKN